MSICVPCRDEGKGAIVAHYEADESRRRPALGPVDFQEHGQPEVNVNWLRGFDGSSPAIPRLDWVVCGGESGPGARPMHPQWARSVRDQCIAARVPFFFKQWGAWAPITTTAGLHESPFGYNVASRLGFARVGKKRAGRLLDGREWNQYPETREGL